MRKNINFYDHKNYKLTETAINGKQSHQINDITITSCTISFTPSYRIPI